MAQAAPPQRRAFHSNTLKYVLLASFALSLVVLWVSHHAISSHAEREDKKELLSVPLPPPRREAAKGGLPPIPDFVKRKMADVAYDDKNVEDKKSSAATDRGDASPSFPLPSDAVPNQSVRSKVVLQPTFGVHRSEQNAVFAFAEGYDLNVYVTFIETLKESNFTGDVVLAVSHIEGMKSGVEEYLRFYSESGENSLRVISYALPWECYKKSGRRILPTNSEGRGSTTNHGFSDCKINGLYSDGKDDTHAPAEDPRVARPVATARYELYWIFSKQYHAASTILIVDARDTFFQSDPFAFHPSPSLGSAHVPANQHESNTECTLDLFEEHYDSVTIGKSSYNSRWIRTAYGQKALDTISDKPVVCSGSTMGSQRAIELYTIAMVAQFDKTKCKQVGCDQGFHNYLYYEGGLKQYLTSHGCSTNVHKQGEGAVNNLAAMRTKPLREWGIMRGTSEDDIVIFNNDKSTPSPVVHQFDRDNELKAGLRKRTTKLLTRWKSNK